MHRSLDLIYQWQSSRMVSHVSECAVRMGHDAALHITAQQSLSFGVAWHHAHVHDELALFVSAGHSLSNAGGFDEHAAVHVSVGAVQSV